MIKRYESYSDTDVVWEDEEGWLVTYEGHCEAMGEQRATHLAIVAELKAEIEKLKVDNIVLNNLNLELEGDVRYWRGREED